MNFTLLTGEKIIFNFCGDTQYLCLNINNQMTSIFDNKCTILANSIKNYNEWSIYYENNTNVLSIKLNNGERCDNFSNYSIIMNITCDPNQIGVYFNNLNTFDLTKCSNSLVGKSNKGKLEISL